MLLFGQSTRQPGAVTCRASVCATSPPPQRAASRPARSSISARASRTGSLCCAGRHVLSITSCGAGGGRRRAAPVRRAPQCSERIRLSDPRQLDWPLAGLWRGSHHDVFRRRERHEARLGGTADAARARQGSNSRASGCARRDERAHVASVRATWQAAQPISRAGTYLTRPSPFADDWPWITSQLERDPALQGTTLSGS